MLVFHAAFILLLVGTQAFFSALAILNVRYAEKTIQAEAEWIESALGVEDQQRLRDYHRLGTGFGQLQSWIGLGVILLILYSGLFADVVLYVEGIAIPPVARGVLFFVGLAAVLQLSSVPFDLVDTFVIEEIFDFNQQTPTLFIRDLLVGLAISSVIVAILGTAVLWFIQAFPAVWWIAAWVLFVGFSLAMLVIYPRVIAPLFNDFVPVDSKDLREAVEDVFDRAGFTTSNIYIMDASRRSSHSNAYFIGFGRTKRVVLFDTLVDQMNLSQVQSILAHELAHWKKAHVWKLMASSAIKTGIVLAILAVLLTTDWLYQMFGVPVGVEYAGLVLAGLWVGPLQQLIAPLENRLSLRYEREADAFAVDVMDGGDELITALQRLVGENLSNPFPHPLYATFHYSHPPIPDRMKAIRQQSGDSAEPEGDDSLPSNVAD